MSELVLNIKPIEVKDEEGNMILSAPLMDLAFFIGMVQNEIAKAADGAELPAQDRYKQLAERLNTEYKCELNWSAALQLNNKVNEKVEELKKKESAETTG